MSCSLIFPSQWDDFESMFDKLVTDRYGPAPNDNKDFNSFGNAVSVDTSSGSSLIKRVLRPKIDIVETEDDYILTAELPGAKKGMYIFKRLCNEMTGFISFFLFFKKKEISKQPNIVVYFHVFAKLNIDSRPFFILVFLFHDRLSF